MPTLPETPLKLRDDAAFLADLPYDPEVLFFDELLEIDAETSRVRCRMPTDQPMPFVGAQRAHPVLHPRHVAGAVMVHATGMLGFIHAYYLLGLRHKEGWIGYGTHIHEGRFRRMGEIGAPMELECQATRIRRIAGSIVGRYRFVFTQGGDVIYEGDQTALWTRVAA